MLSLVDNNNRREGRFDRKAVIRAGTDSQPRAEGATEIAIERAEAGNAWGLGRGLMSSDVTGYKVLTIYHLLLFTCLNTELVIKTHGSTDTRFLR